LDQFVHLFRVDTENPTRGAVLWGTSNTNKSVLYINGT